VREGIVVKEVKISQALLMPILDQMGLELNQVVSITIGFDHVAVDFHALNERGRKYKIGDDIARGRMSAEIQWIEDAPAT
jgi:hypothetical protein